MVGHLHSLLFKAGFDPSTVDYYTPQRPGIPELMVLSLRSVCLIGTQAHLPGEVCFGTAPLCLRQKWVIFIWRRIDTIDDSCGSFGKASVIATAGWVAALFFLYLFTFANVNGDWGPPNRSHM